MNACTNLVSCVIPFLVLRGTAALGSWRALYVSVGAAVALIAALQWAFLLDDDDDTDQQGDDDQDGRLDDETSTTPSSDQPSSLGFVLRHKVVWTIGLTYALLCFVRIGVEGWIATFFEAGGLSGAASFLFWWQLGGFAGASIAGPASDARGGQTPALLSAGFSGLLLAILTGLSAKTVTWRLNALAFLGGACVYATKVLLTLATRLHFRTRDCGKADAVTNALAELGGAVAGLPLIALIEMTGSWRTYGVALALCAAGLCLSHVPLLAAERGLLRPSR